MLFLLKHRAGDDWLVSNSSRTFVQLSEQLFLELTLKYPQTPKILLAYREPVQFLAGFIAACAADCQVFLCNPNWVKAEWQHVFNLVQPDLIWGQEDLHAEIPNSPSPYPPRETKIPNRIMIPTGGSSGKIRFAMHNWETLMSSVKGFQQYFQLKEVNSFCVLPLYHVSGLMQFMRSFTSGGRLVILPSKALLDEPECDINPEEFFISLVPTQLQTLLHHAPKWLSRFQTVLLGGAPAWAELLEQARYHNIRLAPTYGMTETASQIATLTPVDFLNGTNNCGQVLPHAKITIRSTTGEILGSNQIGTIAIQADSLALGYYPENFLCREYFQVDDMGFLDNQGYLNIIGRSGNKIISGGENVFPEEVEAAIMTTNLVTDVCVIGLPDNYWGQVVTAIYVPSNPEVCTDKLLHGLEDKLSKFKQPKYWVSVESLPRNDRGKINREQVQKIALKWLTKHI